MSCQITENGGKRRAVMTFSRRQLLYDVKNYAYIEGSVLETESGHSRHMVQDVGEEGNVDRITRVFDVAIAQCRELLYPYSRHEIRREMFDDKLRDVPVYGIVVEVPTAFSETTLNLISKLIHEYLVCRGVSDWMSITNPGKSEVWRQKASDAMEEIRGSLLTRMTRVRRRTHPF